MFIKVSSFKLLFFYSFLNSPALQNSWLYTWVHYNIILDFFCKKSLAIFQTCIYSSRNFLRGVIYNPFACWTLSMETVEEVLWASLILAIKTLQHDIYYLAVISKQTFYCLNRWIRTALFLMHKLSHQEQMTEILVNWCCTEFPFLSWFPNLHQGINVVVFSALSSTKLS